MLPQKKSAKIQTGTLPSVSSLIPGRISSPLYSKYDSKSLMSLASPDAASPKFKSKSLTSLTSTSSFFSVLLKSPNTPSTSRSQSLNPSSQTSVIEETSEHIVEAYGTPLPVFVTEAITVAERMTDVSVKLQELGWASLVCGRRLFVWRFKQNSQMRNTAAHCKELTLPASDLAHKAELVQIFCSRDSQMPSVVAVSPEGIVRYWPNIAHEGASFEAAADLQGQECYSLTNVQPLGCILATTTGSLVLITPSTSDGQHVILCTTLKLPQGVLAGFGRRVSSFIFGAMPTQSSEAKQLNKVLSAAEKDDKYSLYVLSGSAFQKWCLSEEEPYKLLFEVELDRYIREGFLDALWNGDSSLLHQLKTWCLDMQLCRNCVILLMAGMNPLISQEMFYAFGVLEEPQASAPPVFSSFTAIKYSELYTEKDEEKLLGYRFLFPCGDDEKAYVYDHQKVICVSAFSDVDPDVIDFSGSGNAILGAGSCDSLPLLFTQFHGLLCLHSQGSEQELEPESGSFQDLSKEGTLSDINLGEVCQDLPGKMLMAMRFHCDGEFDACKNVVSEVHQFVADLTDASDFDNTVVKLSLMLLNDFPLSDPRWCESVPAADAISSSLIILHQLEDKLKAHDLLVNFLKSYDLWDKLSLVSIKDTRMATSLVLLEHAEKLVAAKVLRRLYLEHADVVDAVIKDVLHCRAIEVKKPLSHQDMFFREVSHVDGFFPALLRWQNNHLSAGGDSSAESIAKIVGSVNSILVSVFQVVLHFRETSKKSYGYDANVLRVEYVPWTSNEGVQGIRTLFLRQHSINVRYALNLPEEVMSDGVIYQSFMDLLDIILNGFQMQLESHKGKETYESAKEKFSREQTKLISPLLDVKQRERAAALAEKYLDFPVLMRLCEDEKHNDRLQEYCLSFGNEGFPDFAFNWFLEKGKCAKLFEPPLVYQENLKKFLENHKSLGWLYDVQTGQYGSAHQTLQDLGLNETQFLSKKKTLLGLSKLALLASDIPVESRNAQMEALNFEQDLVLYQENLPAAVCENFGLDLDSARVLSPQELIELYTCEENTEANQYDFKLALDLLSFIPKPPGDEYIQKLRQEIWCAAIRRDSWDNLDVSNPVNAMKDTLFFRVIELAFDRGVDLHEFLPPLDDLLQNSHPDMKWIAENSTLQFFLKAAYEHFEKLSV